MTSGSCSCHEHTTNLATWVSRQTVLDCGTIHPDCGGRDFPSILSDDLWKHISLATEAPIVSLPTYRRYINKCIYLSIYLSKSLNSSNITYKYKKQHSKMQVAHCDIISPMIVALDWRWINGWTAATWEWLLRRSRSFKVTDFLYQSKGHATSYEWLRPTYLLCCTVSTLRLIIGQIFASGMAMPHFNALNCWVISWECRHKWYIARNYIPRATVLLQKVSVHLQPLLRNELRTQTSPL